MNIEDIKKFISSIKPLQWILAAVGALVIILIVLFAFSSQPGEDGQIAATAENAVVTEMENGETGTAATTDSESDDSGEQGSETTDLQLAETVKDKEILGEGCDWSTCSWMETDQCVECGGKWQVYGDEAYCDCSDTKWNFQPLEWCKFEGGTWLQDEDRCTFEKDSGSIKEITAASACSELFYNSQSGSEEDYQIFRTACKTAGGVDQCWDEDCSLMVCLCPDEANVSISCDWVQGEAVESSIRCYDENGTCWLNIQPSEAVIGEDAENALPDVVVTTSDGQAFSSINLERESSGCIYDQDQISCLITEDGAFNTTLVEDIYLCMDMCCLNLENMETGSVVVQSGDCPASGNLEVRDFQLIKGVLTFQLRNTMGWDVDTLEIFLEDAKEDNWTTMNCKIDNKYNTIMNCEGWAVYKSGYATISFYYGSGDDACSVNNFKFSIPSMDPCNYDQKYCALSGTCCGASYSCCSCGCRKLDDGETCNDVCN